MSATIPFHLLTLSGEHAADAVIEGDRVLISAGDLASGFGWELKPQGFCQEELCYPVPPANSPVRGDRVDLAAFSALVGAPLALDIEERAAFLGASAGRRAEQLASLEAPDFELPDLDGKRHRLSDHKGKKVLLAAYGSW